MNKNISFFSTMKIKKAEQSSQTTKFMFEHLNLGGAATSLGNNFRQLLLTRVPGWAIFAVKISDKEKTIASEFEKLKGVTEIPLYLIFNLKKLVFQSLQKSSSLQEKGESSLIHILQININNSQNKENYIVTGKDVQGELKIINPEAYLATVEESSQLKIDLYCSYRWGSYTAREQKSLLSKKEENVIFLPSDYCPVKIVSLKTEPVLNTQEEKLSLTITTNGSISPQDSLLEIAKFLELLMTNIQHQLVIGKKTEDKAS